MSPHEENPKKSVPLDEIRRVVKIMKDNDLSAFVFENDGFRIKIERGGAAPPAAAPAISHTPAVAAAAPTPVTTPEPVAAPPQAEGEEITSPMVGTFYRASSPEAAPFVSEGDSVKEGQTLCIIEAMKVMNEIKAEKGGTITAVLAEDATPVQFGQGLFLIK